MYTILPKIRPVRPKPVFPQNMDQECKAFAIVCITPFSCLCSGSSAPEYSASYNEFDTGNLLLAAPASDAPQVPRTHSVGFSSEYGTSQAVPEGPPITASTSGEAQVNPRYEMKPKQGCHVLITLQHRTEDISLTAS